MSAVTIYHNPGCSNSRGALAILRERGVAPVIVEYLKTPPTAEELKALAVRLAATAGAAWPGLRDGMMRTKEAAYGELRLDGAGDDALFAALAAHPGLLNRPIVVTPKGAVLARPPERVGEVL
jgi:arsenate reductase